jgi:alpha-tubulin suppressor-like RCC1 family protein
VVLASRANVVTAGGDHSCAVLDNGNVQCWGSNGNLESGVASGSSVLSPAAITLAGSAKAATISAGYQHTCVVAQGGAVQCWGANASGQRGWGSSTSSATPAAVAGVSNAVSVTSADAHTCALLASGQAVCWGTFAPGVGSAAPTVMASAVPFRAISASGAHTCAVAADGDVYCWGANNSGQLGDGTNTNRSTPTLVNTGALRGSVIAVGAGVNHTCALTVSGAVFCWGQNSQGQLGIGSTTSTQTPATVTLSSALGVASGLILAGGLSHTCVVTDRGPQCWGANGFGQVGDSATDFTPRLSPVAVAAPGYDTGGMFPIYLGYGTVHRGHQLDTGDSFACAVTAEIPTSGGPVPARGVKCWGKNDQGQLGDNSRTARSTPTLVSGLNETVVAVTTGSLHACALLSGGTVQCWGDNAFGQIGNGGTADSLTPTPAGGGINNVLAIAAGQFYTCALKVDGSVWCWGQGTNGQLGDNTNTSRLTPVQVRLFSGGVLAQITQISAGYQHTCAVRADGQVWCWGANGNGQIGIATTIASRSGAVLAVDTNNTTLTAVSCAAAHTCAVKANGTAWCWGSNTYSQLGTTGLPGGTPVFQQLTAMGVTGQIAGVRAGQYRSCVVLRDGTAQCCGSNGNGGNLGALGNGPYVFATSSALLRVDLNPSPGVFTPLTQVSQVATDGYFGCALRADGKVLCWGQNDQGQLGRGTTNTFQSGAKFALGF